MDQSTRYCNYGKLKYESFDGFQSKGLYNIQRINLFYLSLKQSMRKWM